MKNNSVIAPKEIADQDMGKVEHSSDPIEYQLGFKKTIHLLVTRSELVSEIGKQLKKYFDRNFGREHDEHFSPADIHFSGPMPQDMEKMQRGELEEVRDIIIYPSNSPTHCKFYVGNTEVFMKGEYAHEVIELLK